MKQKLGVVVLLLVIVGVLAALSAATYVRKQKEPDSEAKANRSTYNAGATGTQAYFTLLSESGRRPVRWQMPPAALLTAKPADRPAVFVVIFCKSASLLNVMKSTSGSKGRNGCLRSSNPMTLIDPIVLP